MRQYIQLIGRTAALPKGAAFPLVTLKQGKYWTPIGRIDNVYGDRNLFCSCVPVADYAA